MATEFIYDTRLWAVRRLDDGWYQGETRLFPGVTVRTRDFEEARRWIETQVDRFLAESGYVRAKVPDEDLDVPRRCHGGIAMNVKLAP